MTNIMYRVSTLIIATLAMVACQPVDEEPDDTDTTPECAEDETAVVQWCQLADAVFDEISCHQCGSIEACDYLGTWDFTCGILEATYGKLRQCVSIEDAAHCMAELSRNRCQTTVYRWQENCDGFSFVEE